MKEHEVIRKHIYDQKGIAEKDIGVDYEGQKAAVYRSMEQFFTLQRNRILMGRFRYGEFDEKRALDCKDDLERILRAYILTRNTELLVDLANYAWIEFEHGTHPNKHFSPIDDGEHSKQ